MVGVVLEHAREGLALSAQVDHYQFSTGVNMNIIMRSHVGTARYANLALNVCALFNVRVKRARDQRCIAHAPLARTFRANAVTCVIYVTSDNCHRGSR